MLNMSNFKFISYFGDVLINGRIFKSTFWSKFNFILKTIKTAELMLNSYI